MKLQLLFFALVLPMFVSTPPGTCVQKEDSSERKFVQFPNNLSCQLEKLFCAADSLMLEVKEKTPISIRPACASKLDKIVKTSVFFLKSFFVFFVGFFLVLGIFIYFGIVEFV
ncbi:hypothetical protein B9Z55_027690 [Caenorhabditis nigoni]|uniref:Uncharacterized protein n=1 Tax=Caenorhabditis nigoni TaxID=1611254 RepID=A0A2G5SF48_9PELO|nr:hypothetical protein B9Z55_027690 [Caenorhabditis nigoni]